MANWQIELGEKYLRDHAYYEKKRPNELGAVLDNLDTYFKTLSKVGNPMQVTGGYIHPEPDGIIAIDQKGGGRRVKLQQTRLYIYPDITCSILHVWAIGDKTSQRDDINLCRAFVRKLKEERDAKTI